MQLARVIYELFQWEASAANVAARGEPVYLDRQLRLEFADAEPVFVAWTWGKLPNSDYYVGWSHESFCTGPAEVEHDATTTLLWAALVGHPISLHFRDPEQQVLELRAGNAVVFCCSFEKRWYHDTLYVGQRLPEGLGDPPAA